SSCSRARCSRRLPRTGRRRRRAWKVSSRLSCGASSAQSSLSRPTTRVLSRRGIRSFADQLRHVAFWNRYVQKTLRREEADGQANELPAATYPSKTKIMKVLRSTFDDVAKEFGAMNGSANNADADTLISFIEHSG